MREAQRLPLATPGIRPRLRLRLVAAFAIAMMVPPVAASASATRGPVAARPEAPPAVACTATVSGFSASAVDTAKARAGTNGIVCFPAGTYSGNLKHSVAGQTWRLDDASVLTGQVYVTGAGAKLINGRITRSSGNRWIASVEVRAHDVTVKSVEFRGGGTGINVYGKDRTQIFSNSFRGLSGSAISIWSEGVGADNTYIYKNSIVQTITSKVSPITSRGNEGSSHGGVQNTNTLIRQNTINQGKGEVGWFGIELKQSRGSMVHGNTIKGGIVLMSIPETDNASIRWNTFDLRGSPHWGIEVGNAWDAAVERNHFIGDGPGSTDYGLSLNTNPQRVIARFNTAESLRTFFAIAGDGHRVTDNCMRNTRFVQEFALNGGPNIIFARNGPC